MKMIINTCFGGFGVREDVDGYCAELEVVEIPDGATDYYLNEYDGMESIIYVLDGKLHWAGE